MGSAVYIDKELRRVTYKELRMIDLCARLPYGVKITWDETHEITCTPSIYNAIWLNGDTSFKPYLRPMSSMTEKELEEYSRFSLSRYNIECFDWLNAHHFDYRGLIGKGLALEAPEGMYNVK